MEEKKLETDKNQKESATNSHYPENLTPHEKELYDLHGTKIALEYKDYTYSEALKKEDLTEKERFDIMFAREKNDKKLALVEEKMEELETIIEQEKASISRGKHYDKYQAFRNIRELLKGSDIKLGQIEKEAGCQAGYMSRLEKSENATEPTTEFLVTASQLLGVSLDTLLKTTISLLSPTELYMIKFLEKLIRDTADDKLAWVNEPLYTFREIEKSDDGELIHPLFVRCQSHKGLKGLAVSEAGLPYVKVQSYFPSKSFGRQTEVSSDCFHLDMKDQATLYIMSVTESGADDNERGKTAVELWMHNKSGKTTCLCTDHESKDRIIQLVFKLWLAVNQYDTRPKISQEHREIIDSFLLDDNDDSNFN